MCKNTLYGLWSTIRRAFYGFSPRNEAKGVVSTTRGGKSRYTRRIRTMCGENQRSKSLMFFPLSSPPLFLFDIRESLVLFSLSFFYSRGWEMSEELSELKGACPLGVTYLLFLRTSKGESHSIISFLSLSFFFGETVFQLPFSIVLRRNKESRKRKEATFLFVGGIYFFLPPLSLSRLQRWCIGKAIGLLHTQLDRKEWRKEGK